MRVVLTVNYSPWSAYCGGGQQSTHNLATALAQLGHDVTVIYTRPPWERVEVPIELPYRLEWAALMSRRSHRAALLRPLTAITVARRVARLVARREPTVVHGNGEEAALVDRLRREHPFGFVMTPRYPSLPRGLQSGRVGAGAWLRHPRYAVLGTALRGADRWCPTSGHAATAMRRAYGLDAEREAVVPNGIAPAFLERERDPAAAADGPLVFFGRMTRQKGVLTLADALLRLGEDAPRATFIGRGPMLDAVRRRLTRFGARVRFVPWLDASALADEVAAASVVAVPSTEESFGNAMAEAMAVGAPVISTTAGSIPEVVVHDKTGVLVPPEDPAALAAAIATLRDDPVRATALGQAGRLRAAERYTWTAVARRFVEIYDEALR